MRKVVVRGPVLTRSGYGEHVRFVMRSLKNEENLDLYLIPTGWGHTGWALAKESDEERAWLDKIIEKTQVALQNKETFDVSIQVSIPNEWEKLCPVNIGVTAGIETTKVAPGWLEKGNLMDRIIVPSQHSKEVYKKTIVDAQVNATGEIIKYMCETPIDVVGYPVKSYDSCELDLDLKTDFNFLNVAQWGPRKNMENCIRWFIEEFYNEESAGLVLKTNLSKNSLLDRKATENKIKRILEEKNYKDKKCKIYLLHGDFSDQQMHELYRNPKIKALLTTSHGEGFGLPMFEAAYEGLPIIAPEWSGYLDFLCMPVENKKGKKKIKPMFARIDYTLQNIQKAAVWAGVLQADSKWCFVDEGSYKKQTREVFKDHGRFKKQAKQLQAWIKENFSEEKQYSDILESVKLVLPKVEDVLDDALHNAAITSIRVS